MSNSFAENQKILFFWIYNGNKEQFLNLTIQVDRVIILDVDLKLVMENYSQRLESEEIALMLKMLQFTPAQLSD